VRVCVCVDVCLCVCEIIWRLHILCREIFKRTFSAQRNVHGGSQRGKELVFKEGNARAPVPPLFGYFSISRVLISLSPPEPAVVSTRRIAIFVCVPGVSRSPVCMSPALPGRERIMNMSFTQYYSNLDASAVRRPSRVARDDGAGLRHDAPLNRRQTKTGCPGSSSGQLTRALPHVQPKGARHSRAAPATRRAPPPRRQRPVRRLAPLAPFFNRARAFSKIRCCSHERRECHRLPPHRLRRGLPRHDDREAQTDRKAHAFETGVRGRSTPKLTINHWARPTY